MPAEATDESIDAGIEQLESANLLRVFEHPSGERDYLVGNGIVREAAFELLSERDRARLAGRIADALSEERVVPHDIRFEYELRAGRVGRALKSAVRATRNAEERFAYNRSAKLWRWIGDNADKLEDPTVRPDAELARVEHLAGQHAEAAELYNSWAATRKERTRLASIKRDEARAWLQAGQNDRAVEAIEAGFRAFGESYGRRWYSSFREVPTRWLATMDRWNPRIVEAAKVDTATPAQLCLAELYDFVLARAGWLYPERSGAIEARLGRLARSTGDALIVGRHRMRMAVLTAGPGHESSRERSLRWLDEAETLFERAGNLAGRSEVHLHRAILNIRYGEFETARQSLDLAAKTGRRAEDEQANDRRELFYWRAMYHVFVGELEKAERLARQLLHVYRGDRLAASSAYRLLARIALDRGQTVLAEAFVAEGTRSMRATRPNLVTVLWAREETRLDIALGRPEVAVGRLEILREALQKHGLAGHAIFEVPLHVAMGQALSAVYERDRVLGDSHVDQTNARMRVIARRVSKGLAALGALRRAEAHRLLARAELMGGRARKALKHADLAIEALGAIQAPSQVALCAEVRGRVLAALERPDARGIIEQARHMYTHYGIAHPLVLEGWPVPREVSMLKDDQ